MTIFNRHGEEITPLARIYLHTSAGTYMIAAFLNSIIVERAGAQLVYERTAHPFTRLLFNPANSAWTLDQIPLLLAQYELDLYNAQS